jgi:hypothetical protein
MAIYPTKNEAYPVAKMAVPRAPSWLVVEGSGFRLSLVESYGMGSRSCLVLVLIVLLLLPPPPTTRTPSTTCVSATFRPESMLREMKWYKPGCSAFYTLRLGDLGATSLARGVCELDAENAY